MRISSTVLFVLTLCALAAPAAQAQFEKKWLSGGALHNWYSAAGNEVESGGFVGSQQDGMRWPGIYDFTDMQAAKGFWIGARNVTGPSGTRFPFRVVHVGPRVTGAGSFFPVSFDLVSRFQLPEVLVDGELSEAETAMAVDRIDPDLAGDQVIFSTMNTLLGVQVERTVRQFSNPYHDDYHVVEYVFTNTGNTDDDAEIELPNQTLEDVVFFWQWRWSVAKETRYLIGNPSGWGKNAMIDARGDGLDARYGTTDEDFRAMFAWHGFFPAKDVSYDNRGGPILRERIPVSQIAASDTLGRLGASQFVGAVVLHADTSPTNPADDRAQPSVMKFFDSDAAFLSRNDPFSEAKMANEYEIMTTDATERHAYLTEPTGLPGFLYGTRDPSGGGSGGPSAAMGFGPYTLAPGQSVRIVIAEGAGGLSREANKRVGEAYKAAPATQRDTPQGVLPVTINGVSGKTKNEWVFTGRDSLFQTFRRATTNYKSGYSIQKAPMPPSQLTVTGLGDRIRLDWDVYPGESPDGFEVWRARNDYDQDYERVATLSGTERGYDDTAPQRGVNMYYYVVAIDGTTDGVGGEPAGRPLRSSRYYAQTYIPTNLKRPQGENLADIRIVPNPFYLGAAGGRNDADPVRFGDVRDKLAFFNLPGLCRIQIYTELGELVDTIVHTNRTGDVVWEPSTASRQLLVSGVYIAVFTVLEDIPDPDTGDLVFRQGEATYKKFVVIR